MLLVCGVSGFTLGPCSSRISPCEAHDSAKDPQQTFFCLARDFEIFHTSLREFDLGDWDHAWL